MYVVLKITPKTNWPGVGCTISDFVCTRGVQENGVIGLVVLQSTEILVLIFCFAIHFLCVVSAYLYIVWYQRVGDVSIFAYTLLATHE